MKFVRIPEIRGETCDFYFCFELVLVAGKYRWINIFITLLLDFIFVHFVLLCNCYVGNVLVIILILLYFLFFYMFFFLWKVEIDWDIQIPKWSIVKKFQNHFHKRMYVSQDRKSFMSRDLQTSSHLWPGTHRWLNPGKRFRDTWGMSECQGQALTGQSCPGSALFVHYREPKFVSISPS